MPTTLDHFAQRVLSTKKILRQVAADVQAEKNHFLKPIPKKRGGRRLLRIPDTTLAPLLKKSLEYLYALGWTIPSTAYGFVPKRSVVEHASRHLAQPEILHIDLQDFFAHVDADRVRTSLLARDIEADCADLMVDLFVFDGALPQGFATSPFLSNIAFAETDLALESLSTSLNLSYSRYADDLVFSGESAEPHAKAIQFLLESDGWALNHSKTRVERRGQKQYVSGLTVFDEQRPRIPRRLKRAYRLKLYLIKKVGYEDYCLRFGGEDLRDHPRRLLGMARYMASIEPEFGRPLLEGLEANIDLGYMPESIGDWGAEIDAIRNGW